MADTLNPPAAQAAHSPDEVVSISRLQLEALKIAYKTVVGEKQALQKDLGSLLRITNRFMSLIDANASKAQILKRVMGIFNNPAPFAADSNEMLGLAHKHAHLMPGYVGPAQDFVADPAAHAAIDAPAGH